MHKNIFLILFIAIGICGKSQPPTPGSYETNSDLDKLVGTWKWEAKNEVVEFRLQKFRHTVGSFDSDVILGSHTYIQNGVIVESSMNDFVNIPTNHKKRTIYIWFLEGEWFKFEGRIKDITKNKGNIIQLTFVSGNPAQLQVHVEEAEGVTSDPNFQYGFTLPADFTLTKQ